MTWEVAIAALAGLALGAAWTALWAQHRRREADRAVADGRTRVELLDAQAQRLVEELSESRRKHDDANARREAAERQAAATLENVAARERQLEEQRLFITQVEQRFAELSAVAMKANSQHVLTLADQKLGPIKELLEKHQQAVGALETKRETAYATLDQKIQQIAASHEKLGVETGRLVGALSRSKVRGNWGEMQLRNVVELAGMTEHCDFSEQVHVPGEEGPIRPDMVVNLPGGGVIVVDAKVALLAYLDALQPDANREQLMRDHARQVQDHVDQLAKKEYWKQFDRTPGVVVLFMPLESALVAALEINPDLHSQAMARHVLIATPTLLVALLRAVAYGWQQEALTKNAQDIAAAGRDLYDRLATFAGKFADVGQAIARCTREYNEAVGSLERNLLPGSRRLKELQATTQPAIDSAPLLQVETRTIIASELTAREPMADGSGQSEPSMDRRHRPAQAPLPCDSSTMNRSGPGAPEAGPLATG